MSATSHMLYTDESVSQHFVFAILIDQWCASYEEAEILHICGECNRLTGRVIITEYMGTYRTMQILLDLFVYVFRMMLLCEKWLSFVAQIHVQSNFVKIYGQWAF